MLLFGFAPRGGTFVGDMSTTQKLLPTRASPRWASDNDLLAAPLEQGVIDGDQHRRAVGHQQPDDQGGQGQADLAG